jgi:polyketide synthase 12/myxalamid-type polyketide synthase MxaB
MGTIAPAEGLQFLGRILQAPPAQIAVMPVDWSRFARTTGPEGIPKLFSAVAARPDATPTATTVDTGLAQRLSDASPARRHDLLVTFIQEQAGKVLGTPPERLGERVPLHEFGLDSLMAVELRNLLGTSLDVNGALPATLVFDYPTIEAIAEYVERVRFAPQASEPPGAHHDAPVVLPTTNTTGLTALLDSLEGLADDEIDRLVAERHGSVAGRRGDRD